MKFLCSLFDRHTSKTMTDDAGMDSDFKAFRRLVTKKFFQWFLFVLLKTEMTPNFGTMSEKMVFEAKLCILSWAQDLYLFKIRLHTLGTGARSCTWAVISTQAKFIKNDLDIVGIFKLGRYYGKGIVLYTYWCKIVLLFYQIFTFFLSFLVCFVLFIICYRV